MASKALRPCLRAVEIIGTDGTEDMGTVMSTEGAGDFLLHFNHTHIAFDLIVVKGDAKVVHKGQDASFMFV